MAQEKYTCSMRRSPTKEHPSFRIFGFLDYSQVPTILHFNRLKYSLKALDEGHNL
jgi:hypothetical protein